MLHGDSKYIDVLEKILYNGFISGVGLDGKSFFYTNAMQVRISGIRQNSNGFTDGSVEAARSGWFDCSCCPTNVVRLLPSLPGYVYAQKDDKLFVNLFISSNSTMKIMGNDVAVEQKNNYPWDGDLKFVITPKTSLAFSLLIRIPGWAQNTAIPSDLYSFENSSDKKVTIKINGNPVDYTMEKGYAVLNRTWKKDDRVEVNLPMEVRKVIARDKLAEDAGKIALQRGPIMYCAEWPDNNGRASNIVLPVNTSFVSEYKPGMLNGITVLTTEATVVVTDEKENKVNTVKQPFVAIPYYAWANRGKGEMTVWFPERIKDIEIVTH
jgi:DUF1680 family protein